MHAFCILLCTSIHLGTAFCVKLVFRQSKQHISKHKICVMLKLFILSIVLKICIFKTSVISGIDKFPSFINKADMAKKLS